MEYFSTNNVGFKVSAATAVIHSFPKDKGLYLPESIPHLGQLAEIDNRASMAEIAYIVLHPFFSDIPKDLFKSIVESSFNFDSPLIKIDHSLYILELWHGPTLAFKDFGARFMSRIMAYYNEKSNLQKLTILVATSGDTGGAVASGFYEVPGIDVKILFPKGKVSELQELQMCTFGSNIEAIEVEGNFDDCQDLVKNAFIDEDITTKIRLSSANSINIARLLPQMIYYFKSVLELGKAHFIVPSGNFGNICAGVLAREMGIKILSLRAATNQNDTVPRFIQTGSYISKKAKSSLSNAMDVGDPSNFRRLDYLATKKDLPFSKIIQAHSVSEKECIAAIEELYYQFNYISDPHTAIAYALHRKQKSSEKTILLSTAHPSKFLNTVENILGISVQVPSRLANLAQKRKEKTPLTNTFQSLKKHLLA